MRLQNNYTLFYWYCKDTYLFFKPKTIFLQIIEKLLHATKIKTKETYITKKGTQSSPL